MNRGLVMGYLTFFCLNFIFVMFGVMVLAPFLGPIALFLLVCVWVIPSWRWNNCLWHAPVTEMKTSLLRDVHRDWTTTVGYQGGNQLSRVLSGGNSLKIMTAKKRVYVIKKELLCRYERAGYSDNRQLIADINSLEEDVLKA